MKKIRNFKLQAGTVLIISMMVILGCGSKEQKTENSEKNKIENKEVVSVKAAKVRYQKLEITKVYTGTVEGEEQSNLVSYLAERVVEVPVKVGDQVRKDQILVRLDKGGVTSQYYQAESGLQNLEKNLNRMKELYNAGAVSKQSLDEVQTGYDVAKSNFRAAKNAVELSSPIDGVVTEIKVNPGDFTAPGFPIVKVAKINRLKIVLNIGESDIPFIKNGQDVKVYSEQNPGMSVTGKIIEIAKSAELSTRTFAVKVLFSNSRDQWFKSGMFAKAEIFLTSVKESNIIPREAVIYSDKGPQVFRLSDGKAMVKNVKVGLQNDNDIEIIEGVQKDEVIATLGANNLSDGVEVYISNKDQIENNK